MEDQAWGFWKVTRDRETFRWINPATDEAAQDLDTEVSIAVSDMKAAETRLKRNIWRVDDGTSRTSEIRVLSTLDYAARAIQNGDYIMEKYILD